MKNNSPDPQRQKAITPKFLKYLLHFSSPEIRNIKEDHAADLLGGGFFFAMRSCEFTKPSRAGKTKPIRFVSGAGATLATVQFSATSNYCTVSSVAAPPRHPAPSISNTVLYCTVLVRARECGFAI